MTRDSHSRLRSLKVMGVVAFAAAALALTAISCRQVTDPTGTTKLSELDLNACMDKCNKDAATLKFSQDHLHNILIYLCKGNATCISNENARYAAALAKIEQDRLTCIGNCHHQGGATSGR